LLAFAGRAKAVWKQCGVRTKEAITWAKKTHVQVPAGKNAGEGIFENCARKRETACTGDLDSGKPKGNLYSWLELVSLKKTAEGGVPGLV